MEKMFPCRLFWPGAWLVLLGLFVLPLHAQQTPSAPVLVNQVGYALNSTKIAVVSAPLMLPFSVIDAASDTVLYSSRLQLHEAHDAASGAQLWLADFSPLNATGEFRVRVPGIGLSHPFVIDATPYAGLTREAAQVFYGMRYDLDLTEDNAGAFSRPSPPFEPAVVYDPGAATATTTVVVGGWREGSDPNQYTATGAYAAGWLLTTHELFPDAYPDSSLTIPERGNGWPDLLDEAQWQVIWLRGMQREDGGVFHKLATPESDPVAMDSESMIPRTLYPPATASTASACAALAKAARLISPHNATFALSCQEAALQAWRFLERNPDNQPFSNPEGVFTKSYSDPSDSDERMWAALELFLLTGDEQFEAILLAHMEQQVPLVSSAGYWANPTSIVIATMLANPQIEWDEDIQNEMENDLTLLADTLQQRILNDGMFSSLKDDQYTWGSNASLIQNAVLLTLAYRITGRESYQDAALHQLHLILGRNASNRSFVVGQGDDPPLAPFQNVMLDGKPLPPWPGVLVGGPNPGLNDPVLKSRFTSDTPPALCYADDAGSFAGNEYSIEWNAAWLFLLTSLTAP